MNKELIRLKNFDLEAIKAEMSSVPFGNSDYQFEHLSANQETPARKRRHILLQMHEKIRALEECQFKIRRTEIEIEILNGKIAYATGLDRELLQVDLDEKNWALKTQIKFIEDAIFELSKMQQLLAVIPKFTREQFEAQEREYWQKRFTREIGLEYQTTGLVRADTLKALQDIGVHVTKNDQNQLVLTDHSNITQLEFK